MCDEQPDNNLPEILHDTRRFLIGRTRETEQLIAHMRDTVRADMLAKSRALSAGDEDTQTFLDVVRLVINELLKVEETCPTIHTICLLAEIQLHQLELAVLQDATDRPEQFAPGGDT